MELQIERQCLAHSETSWSFKMHQGSLRCLSMVLYSHSSEVGSARIQPQKLEGKAWVDAEAQSPDIALKSMKSHENVPLIRSYILI